MKKRVLSLLLVLVMMVSLLATTTITVSAATITEASFASKIAELQNTFIDGQYWNKYSSSDYSRTGTVKCKCSGSYCAGTCSCSCGQFYHNGKWYGGQCHGYALKLGYLIFGNVATVSWTKHKNAYNVYAGDLVRINNDGHSFFIYKVVGDTIYYTECNNSAPCQVKWGRTMSKATLASKVTYILHNPNYSLTGTGSAPSAPVVNPVHSDTNAHIRNGFFTLKNVASGSYMNVYNGTDANKTAITMWAYDDSTDQQFNVVHQGNGKYKLYAYCSSNGTNRVVDVYRNGAAPVAGQLVDLWTPDDDTAQLFYIVPLDDGSYVFELASKDGYVIAPTSASAAGTNGSQLTLQLYTGANYQKWKFCNNNGGETHPVGAYSADSYKVNTNGYNLTMRSGAGSGYSKVTSVPDTTVLNITQVNSNWGYTTYNGYSGWVCLDFTIYTPSITSISIHNAPYINRYFVGEALDETGMEITATYSNGSTKNITSGFTTSYDFSTAGTKTVTVTYSGKTTSFTVEVVNPTIEDLEITSSATKTTYNVGDTIDTSGLTLKATYNNGSEKAITSGFTTNYDFSTAGTKTVTVTYEGKSVMYNVSVLSKGSASIDVTATQSAQTGDEVVFNVNLSNADELYDGNFNIIYDNSALRYKSHTIGSVISNQNPTVNPTYSANTIRTTFAGTNELKSGNVLKVVFEVIATKACTANIKVQDINLYNISGANLETTSGVLSANCSITEIPQEPDSPINPDSPTITVGETTGRAGQLVDVVIDVSNNPGVALASFDVDYNNNVMTLKAATLGNIFTGELDCNLEKVPFTFNVYSGGGNKTENGTLLTLQFEIKSDCTEGDYNITLSNVEMIDIDENTLEFSNVNGKITVRNSIPGDVTGDGKVTRTDLLRLAKHFSGFVVEIDEAASDVTGDGKVTRTDLLRLAKHFSGFDVVLGK